MPGLCVCRWELKSRLVLGGDGFAARTGAEGHQDRVVDPLADLLDRAIAQGEVADAVLSAMPASESEDGGSGPAVVIELRLGATARLDFGRSVDSSAAAQGVGPESELGFTEEDGVR